MPTGPAPQCLLPSSYTIPQPAAKPWPAIPPAHDLRSALDAINAIRNLLNHMMGLQTQNNQGSKQASGNFTELKRTTATVRVYNPSDSSQWVDVEMITGLELSTKSGTTWNWKR